MPGARHHTVSAFLLDRFTRETKSGRRVCMLDKTSGTPRAVSPRDATVRRHFYSIDRDERRDAAVEGVLATIENAAAPLIRQLENGDFPFGPKRLELALFLAVCWLRTPMWREQNASMMEQVTAAMVAESYRLDPAAAGRALAEGGWEMSAEEVEAFRERFIADLESGRLLVEMPKNLLIRHFLEGALAAAWTMFVLDWTLVRLSDGDELVLADNPVSLHDPTPVFPGGGNGLVSSPNAETFMPIGPRAGVLLASSPALWAWARAGNLRAVHERDEAKRAERLERHEGRWGEGEATSEFVRELNLRSYAHASRYVFGSQKAVQDVHAMRTTRAPRLVQVAPRGPRLHMLEDDQDSPTGVRITQTFAPQGGD